jgi:hypothetical protein
MSEHDAIVSLAEAQAARMRAERRAAVAAQTDSCPACQDAIAYEAARRQVAVDRGELPELFAVEPFLSRQCSEWEHHLREWFHGGHPSRQVDVDAA